MLDCCICEHQTTNLHCSWGAHRPYPKRQWAATFHGMKSTFRSFIHLISVPSRLASRLPLVICCSPYRKSASLDQMTMRVRCKQINFELQGFVHPLENPRMSSRTKSSINLLRASFDHIIVVMLMSYWNHETRWHEAVGLERPFHVAG